MRRSSLMRVLFALLVVVALSFASGRASAAEKDEAALAAAVDRALAGRVTAQSAHETQRRIHALIDKCRSCGGRALGRAYAALGHVASQMGNDDEAKSAFSDALTYDPSVEVPDAAFAEAKKAWVASAPEQDDVRRAGWILKPAYAGFKAALAAEMVEGWSECIDKAKASLTVEENVNTRMLLAECEDESGHLVDALKDDA